MAHKEPHVNRKSVPNIGGEAEGGRTSKSNPGQRK